MKTIHSVLNSAVILLTVTAFISSCRTELQAGPECAKQNDLHTVVFHACEIQTKTAFGPGQDGIYPTLWTRNDSIVKLSLNYDEAVRAVVLPADDFRTATFVADISSSGLQAPYTFYAVSPGSAARALSPSRKAWNISIPAVQTPLDGSADEAAQILAAFSQPTDEIPSDVDLHFSHLTAYGRMSFTNLKLDGAKVERVEITATTPLVGDWYWDCTEDHPLTDNGASSTITLITSSTTDIWFACAPVDMSGQIAVITVYTDKGALVKEVEFPQGRKFNPGRIAVFSVNMSGIEPAVPASNDFKLVTSTSELQAGDEILILDASEEYAIGTEQKTNNRAAAAISVSGHTVSEVPSDVQILTLEAGNSSGTWYMSTGNGYLANANGTKNKLLTVTTKNNNSLWTISIDSSGAATVTAQEGERNLLRFNDSQSSNLLFACYASGQKGIVIYRKGAAGSAGPVQEDPITDFSEYGCYLGSNSRSYVPGADQFCRSYSSAGVQTFTILDPAQKEQLEISGYRRSLVKGDEVSITVQWRKGLTGIVSGSTYKVRVVKEEGPKVWLGNGSGQGFIIKK